MPLSRIAAILINQYAEDPIDFDHFVPHGIRPPEEPLVIPKLESTVEELRDCFGPDFDYDTRGAR